MYCDWIRQRLARCVRCTVMSNTFKIRNTNIDKEWTIELSCKKLSHNFILSKRSIRNKIRSVGVHSKKTKFHDKFISFPIALSLNELKVNIVESILWQWNSCFRLFFYTLTHPYEYACKQTRTHARTHAYASTGIVFTRFNPNQFEIFITLDDIRQLVVV